MLGPHASPYVEAFQACVEIALDLEEDQGASPVSGQHLVDLVATFHALWKGASVVPNGAIVQQDIFNLHRNKRLWIQHGDTRGLVLARFAPVVPLPVPVPPTPKPKPIPPIIVIPTPPRPAPTPKPYPTPFPGTRVDSAQFEVTFGLKDATTLYTIMVQKLLTEHTAMLVKDADWASFAGKVAGLTSDGYLLDLNQLDAIEPNLARALSVTPYQDMLRELIKYPMTAQNLAQTVMFVGEIGVRESFVDAKTGGPVGFLVASLPVLLALFAHAELHVKMYDLKTGTYSYEKSSSLLALYDQFVRHIGVKSEPTLVDWLYHVEGDSLKNLKETFDYAFGLPSSGVSLIRDAREWFKEPSLLAPSLVYSDLVQTEASWKGQNLAPPFFAPSSFGAGMEKDRERDLIISAALAMVRMFSGTNLRVSNIGGVPKHLFDSDYGILFLKTLYLMKSIGRPEAALNELETFTLQDLCSLMETNDTWMKILRTALCLAVYVRMLCYHAKLNPPHVITLAVSDTVLEYNLKGNVSLPLEVKGVNGEWGINDWSKLSGPKSANRAVVNLLTATRTLKKKDGKAIVTKSAIDPEGVRKLFMGYYGPQAGGVDGGSGLPNDPAILDQASPIVEQSKKKPVNVGPTFAGKTSNEHLEEEIVAAPVISAPAAPVVVTAVPEIEKKVHVITLSTIAVTDPDEKKEILENWQSTTERFPSVPDKDKSKEFLEAVTLLYANAETLKQFGNVDILKDVKTMYDAIPSKSMNVKSKYQIFQQSYQQTYHPQ